jgi:hypothetical protein
MFRVKQSCNAASNSQTKNQQMSYRSNYIYKQNLVFICCFVLSRVKGKAIPLQVWADPEASRRLRLPDFNTLVI